MKLQSGARSARPLISGGRVAFDFAPPATFTSSHYFESLVPIMLVDKNEILLTRSWASADVKGLHFGSGQSIMYINRRAGGASN